MRTNVGENTLINFLFHITTAQLSFFLLLIIIKKIILQKYTDFTVNYKLSFIVLTHPNRTTMQLIVFSYFKAECNVQIKKLKY